MLEALIALDVSQRLMKRQFELDAGEAETAERFPRRLLAAALGRIRVDEGRERSGGLEKANDLRRSENVCSLRT